MSDLVNGRELVDRDKLNNASRLQVSRTCVDIFDRIQSATPEQQLLGLCAAFMLLTEAARMPTQDVYAAVRNIMHDPLHATGKEARFAAMLMHLRDDLVTARSR